MLAAFDADVHVQSVHTLAARGIADVPDQLEVALLLDDGKRLERRGRMRTGRRHGESVRARDAIGCEAQVAQRRDSFGDVSAYTGVELDDGRVHLRLQRPRQIKLVHAAQQHLDGAHRLERVRVEDHELLLDAERERGSLAEVGFDHFRMPCTGRPAASHA